MNAPVTITAAPVSTAIERANAWVDVARPIIMAYVHMDDETTTALRKAQLADPTSWKQYSKQSPGARAWDEARQVIGKARNELWQMLDGIRENFVCDECVSGPDGDEPENAADHAVWSCAWDDSEEFNDDLRRGVISVDAAHKLVESEMFPGWGA